MPEPIRVMIADDHEIVRDGLRLILEGESDFVVVGEASDGVEAMTIAAERNPDVILMDVRMPRMSGIEALAEMKGRGTAPAVVVLTTYDDDGLVRDALRAGARGYLLKDTGRKTLFRTIRAAARGETLLPPDVVRRVVSRADGEARVGDATGMRALTRRELEILEAVTRGERSRNVAAEFGITERTVKAHLASIYRKLGVSTRAAAVARAIRSGLAGAEQ